MISSATESGLRTDSPGRQPHAEGWLTPGRFAVLLALLVFATFPGVLLGKTTFVFRDFGLFSYPVAWFQRESFWRGELPLWNPLNFCGTPFLAQWNTLALYPLSLIYLLLPLTWSLPSFCLAHLFWGGLGMYFLARSWTRHCLAAGLAGIIFSFNGLALNFLMWPSHIATFSWLPWVLWLAQPAWRQGGRRMFWAIGAGAMQMLAGGPETILFTWLLLALLAGGDWLHGEQTLKRIGARLFGMGLLVGLVCAAQLLPFLELLSHSQRDSGFAASNWPMPVWGWANLVVPLFRAIPTSQGPFHQPEQFWTSSYYVGIATLWLAAIAIKRASDRRARLLALLAVLALVLALGDRGLVYHALRRVFPLIGFARYPVKFVILAAAVAPLLAAFGLVPAISTRPRRSQFEWLSALTLVLVAGGLVWLDWLHPLAEGAGRTTSWNAAGRVAFLAVSVLLAASFVNAPARSRLYLGALLLAVCWLDLVTHMPAQNPSVRPSVFAPGWASAQLNWKPAPKLGGSRIMLSPSAQEAVKYHSIPNLEQNYLLDRLAFLADCNLLDSVPNFGGFFSITPDQINNLVVLPYLRTEREFPSLLDFCGVAQTSAPGKIFDWTSRPTAMPLVSAGQRPFFAEDPVVFASFFQTNIDLRRVVFLPAAARHLVRAAPCPAARIIGTEFANQKISIRVQSPAPALVVVAQSWYPAWKAYVDGVPAKLWRANYAFQTVEIPAGAHQVVLRYRDAAFLTGLILSGLGLAGCLGLWWGARRAETASNQCL